MSAANPLADRTPRSPSAARQDLSFSPEEEQLLRLDLSDLSVPDTGSLDIEALKPSWLSRLFGRR